MALGGDFDTVLAAARGGAEWAFSRLYRDLNPRLFRYLVARAPGVGDDLASETWLAAARQLPGFEGGEEAFRAWLFTIARRCLIQHWRDGCRRPPTVHHPEALPDQASGADGPEEVVLEGISALEAARAIAAALSPDQADVVLLRMLAGLDVDQVAAILGKRPGAVRVLQHRGLRRLAQVFSLESVTQ